VTPHRCPSSHAQKADNQPRTEQHNQPTKKEQHNQPTKKNNTTSQPRRTTQPANQEEQHNQPTKKNNTTTQSQMQTNASRSCGVGTARCARALKIN
jgi:hypothetical protein